MPELPLEGVNAKGLFTGTLTQALYRGEVDLCVHSLKDMPEVLPEELPIVAYSKRGDPRDALILPEGSAFNGFGGIDASAPIGCSSIRRRLQLLALAPEIRIASIRGNVPTRLSKLQRGQYGAIVLAMAGLLRLGLSARAGYVFSAREMVPAAGQGILAVQGRKGEDYSFLGAAHDPVSGEEASAERTLISALGCGYFSPAAAFANISGNEIKIIAMFGPENGAGPVVDEIAGERRRAGRLAEELAQRLLKVGGKR